MKTAVKTTAKKSQRFNSNSKTQDKFITNILDNLDKVNAKDWEQYTNFKFHTPQNLFTKNSYKGFNILALYIDTLLNGYKSSYYATFNSIAKAGGRLKKGAKGTVIEFFSMICQNSETKKRYTLEQISALSEAEKKLIIKIPCVKNYYVFNSQLIENLEELNLDITIDEAEENEFLEQENCEIFLNSLISKGLKIEYVDRNTGAYSPYHDKIIMPERKYFISENKFYSTIFHEIIHWTGHDDRLNRNLSAGTFGNEKYSFEELIAEMGSMLICLQFGISEELINSFRYLKGWSATTSGERNENLKKAFIESKKAKKYLENL